MSLKKVSILKVTSPRVAAEASEILRGPRYGIKPKSVAGSALSQSAGKALTKRQATGILNKYRAKTQYK